MSVVRRLSSPKLVLTLKSPSVEKSMTKLAENCHISSSFALTFSMKVTPVRMVVEVKMVWLPLVANFLYFLVCLNRVSMGVGETRVYSCAQCWRQDGRLPPVRRLPRGVEEFHGLSRRHTQ